MLPLISQVKYIIRKVQGFVFYNVSIEKLATEQ